MSLRWPVVLLCACSRLGDDLFDDTERLRFAITWSQEQESEIVTCHTFKAPNQQRFAVGRVAVSFPQGSHHVHIYRSSTPEPDGVTSCTSGVDWTRWSMVVAVQFDPLDWKLPEGTSIQLEPDQQLMVQVHWLNISEHPVEPTIELMFEAARSSSLHELGTAFGVAKDVLLRQGDHKRVSGFVPLPEGSRLVAIMGHFHARGHGYRADIRRFGDDVDPPPIYQVATEDDFIFRRLHPAPTIPADSGVAFACDFVNTTDGTLTWGADTKHQEHCNVALYFVASEATERRVILSGDVTSISAAGARGEVLLNALAGPSGVDVALGTDVPSVQVPALVHVAAWTDRAEFDVLGEGAGTLTATTGSSVVSCPSGV